MQFGGETTIIEMVRSNKGKESIMGLLEGLESCVEQFRGQRVERKANQEIERQYESCMAILGRFF